MELNVTREKLTGDYIGIDPTRNIRDVALNKIGLENIAVILVDEKISMKTMDKFYNSVEKLFKKNVDLTATPVTDLAEQNKLMVVSESELMKQANSNSAMPSWINLEDGKGVRFDAWGKPDKTFDPVSPAQLEDLRRKAKKARAGQLAAI